MRCVGVPVISLEECGGGGEIAFFAAERVSGGGMRLLAGGLRVGWVRMEVVRTRNVLAAGRRRVKLLR